MQELRGKAAVVTGGGSGIGRSLAITLAKEGVRVVVADIMLGNGQKVAKEIQAAGGESVAVHCDVSDRASVTNLRTQANACFGPVTLLFPNAGATSFERLTEMSERDIDWIIQVDLMGVTNCLTTFLPDMKAKREGHVVATASAAGLLPAWIPYHAPYSAAKMGVIGLMLNLRYELAEMGVGATVLCPFGVETGMRENNQRYRPDRFGGPRDEAVKLPGNFFEESRVAFRSPDEVALMVLRAVRNNRPMVVTDPTHRKTWVDTYANVVMGAFDEVEAFDREQR